MEIPSKKEFEIFEEMLKKVNWETRYPTDREVLIAIKCFRFTGKLGNILNLSDLSFWAFSQSDKYHSMLCARGL